MARYTIFRSDGSSDPDQGYTLEDAAHALLTSDGYAYEIRTDADGCHSLYISISNANSTCGARHMLVCPGYAGFYRAAVLQKVVESEWRGYEAMTDNDYNDAESERAAESREEGGV